MTKEELQTLQRYIGKRSKGQDTNQVIAHIEKKTTAAPFTNEEWEQLFYPACASCDEALISYLLTKVKPTNIVEVMLHTVGSQEKRYDYIMKRIEILDILLKHISYEERKEVLSKVLLHACWFGELGIVKYVIEQGADIHYQDDNGKNALDYAQTFAERFHDDSLYQYLRPHYDEGTPLGAIEPYYGTAKVRSRWRERIFRK